MAGEYYEIDWEAGTVRTVNPDGSLGPDVGPTVTVGGKLYTIEGRQLVDMDNPFIRYSGGSQGPSSLIDAEGYRWMLVNEIQPGSLNSYSRRTLSYGVTGDIDVLLASGDVATVNIEFASISANQYRAGQITNENGDVTYFNAPIFRTNRELQEFMSNDTARYLSPQEASQRAVFRYLIRHEMDLLRRIADENGLSDIPGLSKESAAADMLAKASFNQLTAISRNLVSY